MSTLTANVISAARSKVGYREGPRNNQTIFWAQIAPSFQGQPWCGGFATWCWLQAGIDIRPYVNPYSASALRTWAKKIGAYSTSEHEDGDIVLYGFGDSKLEHIGISWRDNGASGYRAIEGNTSSGSAGSQANGGGVYVRYRGRRSIDGWVRMSKVIAYYKLAGAGVGKEVTQAVAETTGFLTVDGIFGRATAREIQERLKLIVPDLIVDGVFGEKSIAALQAWFDLSVRDGKISGQSAFGKKHCPAIPARCFDSGRNGSKLVRFMQAYAGVKVDGLIGPETITAWQKMLNSYTAFLTREDFAVAHERLRKAGLR